MMTVTHNYPSDISKEEFEIIEMLKPPAMLGRTEKTGV